MQIDYGVTWDNFPGLMTACIRHAFARAFHHQAGKGKFSRRKFGQANLGQICRTQWRRINHFWGLASPGKNALVSFPAVSAKKFIMLCCRSLLISRRRWDAKLWPYGRSTVVEIPFLVKMWKIDPSHTETISAIVFGRLSPSQREDGPKHVAGGRVRRRVGHAKTCRRCPAGRFTPA